MNELDQNNSLPVDVMLSILQSVDHEDLNNLTNQQWYQTENALRKPIEEQVVPVLVQDAITWHDTQITARDIYAETKVDKKFHIRELQFADTLRLANVGPQIIEVFFDGDADAVTNADLNQVISAVVKGSMSARFTNGVSKLSYQIIDIMASLIVNPDTEEYMNASFIFGQRPEVAGGIIETILELEALFFSYVQQKLPEGIRDTVNTLLGMLTKTT